jgi:hypothetical protein
MPMLRAGTQPTPTASAGESRAHCTFGVVGYTVRMQDQLYPIVQGVIAPGKSQSKGVYAAFNQAWPNWVDLSSNSPEEFPWVVVFYAAFLEQDNARVNHYVATIQNKYMFVDPAFSWPWYNAEAGWFMRVDLGAE